MNNKIDFTLRQTGLGLGDIICILSLLLDTKHPVCLHETVGCSRSIGELKTIFNIPDTILKIDKFNNESELDLTVGSKFFSPYITVENLNLFGRSVPINQQPKPCIALIMNNAWLKASDKLGYKYYSPDTWSEIAKLMISFGYDIITIDSTKINLEQKVYLLNEFCLGVISYEGGLAHLAHVLKIPTIMLPWQQWNNNSRTGPGLFYAAQRFHIDPCTWFLSSSDELLLWSKKEFADKINMLKNKQGNNIYLTDQVEINQQTFEVKSLLPYNLDLWLNEIDRAFIHKYILKSVV